MKAVVILNKEFVPKSQITSSTCIIELMKKNPRIDSNSESHCRINQNQSTRGEI